MAMQLWSVPSFSCHPMSSLYLGDTGCCDSVFMPDGWVTSTTSFFFSRGEPVILAVLVLPHDVM